MSADPMRSPMVRTLPLTPAERVAALKTLRRRAAMERASFRRIGPSADDAVLPKSEADVDAFIMERVRLYIETWVLPPLDNLIAEAEGRSVPLHDYVLDYLARDQ